MNIKLKFENELIEKTLRAKKECGYNPTRYNQMIAQYGGLATAKKLIQKSIITNEPSEGYITLLLLGRVDLSMEESVVKPEYSELFNTDEIIYCENLLAGRD